MSASLTKALFNPQLYTRLCSIWFEGVTPGASVPTQDAMRLWFGQVSPEEKVRFDGQCQSEFGPALDSVGPGSLPLPEAKSYAAELQTAQEIAAPFMKEIREAPHGEAAGRTALGLLLLLDQIPRNIHRKNQALVYNHYDRISRSVLRAVLASDPRPDLDKSLRLSYVHRLWFYMPFMHSEHLEDHEIFTTEMTNLQKDLLEAGNKEAADFMKGSFDFEQQHVDIIKRFGRYPHRNVHLGRTSTEEEIKYLADGAATFGTG